MAAFYVVWMNRASEKIITAVLPISAAALIGIFMAVFVFGGQTATTIQFPAMFIFESPENLPVSIPFRPTQMSLWLVPLLKKNNPELMKDDDQGTTLYHHLLQKAIVETLAFRYGSTWKANIIRYDVSTGKSEQYGAAEDASGPSEKISREQLEHLMTENRFARVSTPMVQELNLPPGTSIKVSAPHFDPKLGQVSSIILDNDFIRITIETRASNWGVLFGGYRLIMGQANDTNTNLRQASYDVKIRREYKRLRTGHPEMPAYTAWADQVTEELQREFDEQRIWAKSKEDYIFSRQLGLPTSPNLTQPFGVLQAPEQQR